MTNKLKLDLFGVNVSNGCAITTVEGRHEVSWPNSLAIARTADRHGYEAMVPVARWRGFGGESNFNGTNFETYTWAAGLGQATENICVLTTSHVPTIHPIVAAKQATTVEDGRAQIDAYRRLAREEYGRSGAIVTWSTETPRRKPKPSSIITSSIRVMSRRSTCSPR
jgi:Luciferase-like monooxygenase